MDKHKILEKFIDYMKNGNNVALADLFDNTGYYMILP